MKKIINLLTLIITITISFNCSAQQHFTDPNADKFVGTWKWGDNINGLTLIMKKENNVQMFDNDLDKYDNILGFHKIYKNGQLTEDKTIFSNTNFIDQKFSFIAGTSIHESNPNELRLLMTHKKKHIELKIVYIDSTHIKITEVKNSEGIRVILPGQTTPTWSIDIPNNIILIKQ